MLFLLALSLTIYMIAPFPASMQEKSNESTETAPPEFLIGGNAGDLDPTFLNVGRVSLNLTSGTNDFGNAVTRQPDGKILIGGDMASQVCVVRYNVDGSLDQSFGNSAINLRGAACSGFGASTASDIVLQPDGKIVLVGAYNVGGTDRYSLIVRFNADGSLDTTFSGDGHVEYSINGGDDYSIAGALQPDGKLVVGGKINDVSSSLLRFNTDGSIDSTFGSGGNVVFGYAGYSRSLIHSVAFDSSGRIVVGGYGLGSNNDFVFARFTSSGAFDTSFTGGNGAIAAGVGRIVVQPTANNDYCTSMALQPDGKIVGAGYSTASSSDFTVVRLNSLDGALDIGFDGDGLVQSDFGNDDIGVSVAVQSDGKIVVAGESNANGLPYDFAVARYNPNGSPDTGFDGDGKLLTRFNTNNSRAQDVLVQPDGKIVAAGRSNWATVDFAVARYNPNGTPDQGWGSGKKQIDFGGNDDFASDAALQTDGKLVVAGRTLVGGNFRFGLARFNADGTTDNAFGAGGKSSPFLVNSDYGESVAIDPVSGKIYVGGFDYNGAGDYDFMLARYHPTGVLDSTFGTAGFARRHNSSDDRIYSIALLSDGDVAAVGYTVGGNVDIAVLRFDVAANSWDTAFDGDGLRVIPFANTDIAYDVAVDSNGKLVIAGATHPTTGEMIVMRLDAASGVNDPTFNGGFPAVHSTSFDDEARAIAIMPDNRIVVTGYANTGANAEDFAVFRLTDTGQPDSSFDFDGRQIVTFSSTSDIGHGVGIQPDGKILLSGYAFGGMTNDFGFARLNPDGSLDSSFGAGGRRTFDLSGYHDHANGKLLLLPDGKAVAVGQSINGVNTDFGVVRILTTSTADCGYSLSQTTQTAPLSGGSFSVGLTTTGDCTWTATSNASWLTFTGTTNGTGSGSVNYSVAPNPSSVLRSGTITIGGQVLNVTQFGSNVAVSVPTNLTGQNGAVATIPINVSDTAGQGIISYDFTVNYDPAVLTPNATPFDSTGTLSNDFTVTVNASTPGTVIVSGFGSAALDGAGVLLNLKFNVVGNYPSCSAISFAAFEFNAGIPPNQTTAGQFCVINGSISGVVTYINGTPTTPNVPGVTVTASGASTIIDSTDNTGSYELDGFANGAYTVTPSKTGDVNGIQALDASRIAQHVVGLITLTPNQRTAGDTNNNGSLNSFDAALIAQYTVGIPNPASIAGTWKFLPASRSYSSVFTDVPNQDYSAILVGDVTGNWAPPGPFGAFAAIPISADDGVDVSLPALRAKQNSIVTVPVSIGKGLNKNGALAYELDLAFDPSVVRPDDIAFSTDQTLSSDMAVTISNLTPGRSRIAVFGAHPIENEGILIKLRFRVVGEPGAVSALNWERAMLNEGLPSVNPANGSLTVVGRQASTGVVRGRALTSTGRGVRNAILTLRDETGATRTVQTGSFGWYEFTDVPIGPAYTLTITSKRTVFANSVRTVLPTAELTEENFVEEN